MTFDALTKWLLVVVVILLAVLTVRSYVTPLAVHADSGGPYPFYIEPGVAMLRAPDGSQQVIGKVVVDLRNGNVWGFPTLQQDPYPAAGATTKIQTSHPFLLGKYAFQDTEK